MLAVFTKDYCTEKFSESCSRFSKVLGEIIGMLGSHDRLTSCFGTKPLKDVLFNNL